MNDLRARSVVLIGSFAPPVTGQTSMNEALRERLFEAGCALGVFDISHGRRVGGSFRIRRAIAVLRTAALLALGWRRVASVILSYERRAGPVLLGTLVLMRLFGERRRLVVWVHQAEPWTWGGRLAIRTASRAYRSKLVLIGLCSRHLERVAAPMGPSAPARRLVCSNQELLSLPTESETLGDGPLELERGAPTVVGMLGNLTEAKGALTFLRVAEQLGHRDDLEFRMAGPTADNAVRSSLDSELGRRVVYAGALSETQKWGWLRDVEIFLYPTLYELETEPLVLLEARAVGASLISSDLACIPSILSPDDIVTTAAGARDVSYLSSVVLRLADTSSRRNAGEGPTEGTQGLPIAWCRALNVQDRVE